MSWYRNDDVTEIAKQLLGKLLCTNFGGVVTKGKIVETEAYSGYNDKACHANNQKKTKRNKVMFAHGGHAYVYLCYGIHHLFNVVTNKEGSADAVLIRAVEPVEGVEIMLKRRSMTKVEKRLTAGPGVLSQALGIQTIHYGTALNSNSIWIEEGEPVGNDQVGSTTRIGVDYAEGDALKPWRFYIKENGWVSRF
ncbi:MAG: DNA-3-methyladenine glycosylase [Cyclobacteriaceae bacterium]|nr:DNA-3-methyladenine glycosylase [Cyclobacteriaceae bacterium]